MQQPTVTVVVSRCYMWMLTTPCNGPGGENVRYDVVALWGLAPLGLTSMHGLFHLRKLTVAFESGVIYWACESWGGNT